MQSDGPENFIDPASHEEVAADSTEEPSQTSPSGPLHELRRSGRRDERAIRLAKAEKAEHEATKAKHEAAKTKHEAVNTRHEATKAKHEANAQEWIAKHARKRSLTDLWRDWIFLGILIVVALAGIGVTVYGVVTESTRVMVTGVAILSGTSGTAILGLTKNRARNDENRQPPA